VNARRDQNLPEIFRTDAPVSLGDGLRRAIRDLGLSRAFRAHRAVMLWTRAAVETAGPQAGERSQAERLEDDGTLLVTVDGDAWRHRLMMDREVLRHRLNEWIGTDLITSVRFRKGPIPLKG